MYKLLKFLNSQKEKKSQNQRKYLSYNYFQEFFSNKEKITFCHIEREDSTLQVL